MKSNRILVTAMPGQMQFFNIARSMVTLLLLKASKKSGTCY